LSKIKSAFLGYAKYNPRVIPCQYHRSVFGEIFTKYFEMDAETLGIAWKYFVRRQRQERRSGVFRRLSVFPDDPYGRDRF
jgi:hypothetical protein